MHLVVGRVAVAGLQGFPDAAPHGFQFRHTLGQRLRMGVTMVVMVVVVMVVVLAVFVIMIVMPAVAVVGRMAGSWLGGSRGRGRRPAAEKSQGHRGHTEQHTERPGQRTNDSDPVTGHRRTHHVSPDGVGIRLHGPIIPGRSARR